MKYRRLLKVAAWVLLTPVVLLLLLAVLLYVPPVQNFVRSQAEDVVSDATGLDVKVGKIRLRFPLNLRVHNVSATRLQLDSIGQPVGVDTVFGMDVLSVKVQALPLLRRQVHVDDITMRSVSVNTLDLLPGMVVEGTLGQFALESHSIDLAHEEVVLNKVALDDTQLSVLLNDTTEAETDTTRTSLKWRIKLKQLDVKNCGVDLLMPLDTLRIGAYLSDASALEGSADLASMCYSLQTLRVYHSRFSLDRDSLPPSKGFDARHVSIAELDCAFDSLNYCNRNVHAVISQASFRERSGLTLASMSGAVRSDDTSIYASGLKVKTSDSEVNFQGQADWSLLDDLNNGLLTGSINARIGKEDVMLFAGDLPASFKKSYPFHPLIVRAEVRGNMSHMEVSKLSAHLPSAFHLNGYGNFYQLTDSLQRKGNLSARLETYNLNFLTTLAGGQDGSLAIPDSMKMDATLTLHGQQVGVKSDLRERQGLVTLSADYNMLTEAYAATVAVKNLQIDHFLPKDSIFGMTANASVKGRGLDFTSRRSVATLQASVDRLQYKRFPLSNIQLNGSLKNARMTASLMADNTLFNFEGNANMLTNRAHLTGNVDMNIAQVDLYKMGFVPRPLKQPFAMQMKASAGRDSMYFNLDAGDCRLRIRAQNSLDGLIKHFTALAAMLDKQITDRQLDHVALREAMPVMDMTLVAGRNNPFNDVLSTYDMSFQNIRMACSTNTEQGINGDARMNGLKLSRTLQLDTIRLAARQDTSRLALHSAVINGKSNPHVFTASVDGEVRSEDADLMMNYTDGNGNTGVQLGLKARPLKGGRMGNAKGLFVKLTPEEPVVAYRKFHFAGKRNWIYLHQDMRVYANVDMTSTDGLYFRMQSDRSDSVSLQNMNVELSRLQLADLSGVIPYMPQLSGLFSIEATYVQTATSLQLSTEANVQGLTYEKQKVGDLGMGLIWVPDEQQAHYIDSYLTYNDKQILTAGGIYRPNEGNDGLDVDATVEHCPMSIVNAFVPGQMVTMDGFLNGDIRVTGSLDKPLLNGSLAFDSTSVYARQAGARYKLDNRAVTVRNNQMKFDKFSIYTTNNNPFVIDGNVDFRNFEQPTANLLLQAKNYTLLDAPKTRESLLYGKVLVDLDASIRGPLDGLVMRGNMNVLGSTNATYVMTNTPLTVEDRFEGLVTFTSFNDTLKEENEVAAMSLGGMDMVMVVHIDDNVRMRADLTLDGSKYVELVGGGDLNMQYTPQGDVSLSGRYTLSGGSMKYSLPVIPLKEFQFSNGSYVDWRGDPMNPRLNLTATERIKASVANDDANKSSRRVNFDISISILNQLAAPDLIFDISAPEDASIQNELLAMGAEERSKQAITMLATGIYLNRRGNQELTMGTALNSVLQSQINTLAGTVKNANISVDIENRTAAETGDTQTDYSFKYSQRFFNDRVQIIIGGKVSTGTNATNNVESFIDNVSLEYRLDPSGTRYVRAFHNKNYESVLDGEITETGAGLVFRKKLDRLSDLFLFKSIKEKVLKKKEDKKEDAETNE